MLKTIYAAAAALALLGPAISASANPQQIAKAIGHYESGFGQPGKPAKLDLTTIPYKPAVTRISGCHGLRAGVDKRWPSSASKTKSSVQFKSKLNSDVIDALQPIAPIVDNPVPMIFVTISCDRNKAKFTNLSSFTDRIADSFRKGKKWHGGLHRGSITTKAGRWETVQGARKHKGVWLDSLSAYTFYKDHLVSVTIRAERWPGQAKGKDIAAGRVVQVQGLNGAPLTIKTVGPARTTGKAIFGLRTAEQNRAFIGKFLGTIR
ncbi:hypothetical protein [Thalassococcus lentus]|uniref:Uncharacterized protein n=1 Tax=Thalassococcus lentus TaxID=1210524 RepID=A0ABT4XW04_9RHOB|nr:hypothetical protein [Thalassococcus lentus]MDA7426143.1 hypothetical protein [Thalassococcus lentus]